MRTRSAEAWISLVSVEMLVPKFLVLLALRIGVTFSTRLGESSDHCREEAYDLDLDELGSGGLSFKADFWFSKSDALNLDIEALDGSDNTCSSSASLVHLSPLDVLVLDALGYAVWGE